MGLFASTLMYADDLVLLAPSVTELQMIMVNYCYSELKMLDLEINSSKSVAKRISSRCNTACNNLFVSNQYIQWAKETKYLGIFVVSGNTFKCDLNQPKCKLYRSANSILSKIGNCNNSTISTQLIVSIALPVLTYGIEALSLTKSKFNVQEHSWSRMFHKIFKTFDMSVIRECQFHTTVVRLFMIVIICMQCVFC